MADTLTVGQDLEGRILAGVHKGDAVAYETARVLVDAIEPIRSTLRSVTPPLVYDFTEQFLIGQRKFAEDLLHLTERLAPASAKSVSAPQK